MEILYNLPFTVLEIPNLKIKRPSWFQQPSAMAVFAVVLLSYFLVTGGKCFRISLLQDKNDNIFENYFFQVLYTTLLQNHRAQVQQQMSMVIQNQQHLCLIGLMGNILWRGLRLVFYLRLEAWDLLFWIRHIIPRRLN